MWELCCHDSMSVVMVISSHHRNIIGHEMFTDFHSLGFSSSFVLHILEYILVYVSRLVILSLKIKGTDWSTFAMYWGTTLTLLVMYPGF